MAPHLIGPAAQRQKDKVKNVFQGAVKKIATESQISRVLTGAIDSSALEQDFGPTAFGEALQTKPEDRNPEAVREALDWWLTSMPSSGLELSPELKAPDSVIFEAFCRGRLSVCMRNQIIQEEGEEVKYYTIILFGHCKLRCAKPAAYCDDVKDDAKTQDSDGFINIETIGRGESLGMLPGDTRSAYNIISMEKTTLLRLSAQDYEATFRPYHREFFSRTVDFLQQHRICPEASNLQLSRLAPFLRQRRIPRGRIFLRSGEAQRHLYFLREGSCSVLVHDSPDGAAGTLPPDDEVEGNEDESADKHDKFVKMRHASYGARMQQATAFDEQRKSVVKSLARGPLRQSLAGTSRQAFRTTDSDMHASALLSEPGLMLGEEAFVYDNLRDWVNLRNCYSVRAVESSSFLVADITAFRQLAALMASKGLTQSVSNKLSRRSQNFARGKNVTQSINKRAQDLKAEEMKKLDRQKLRLPKCAGYPAVEELENFEDYLDVVLDHRKAPVNLTQLPTLACLEGTTYGPKHDANGPAVNAMLRLNAQYGHCRSAMYGSRDYRDSSPYEANPLGGTVSAGARYADTSPPGSSPAPLALMNSTTGHLGRSESLPELRDAGVFFATEVDFEDGMTLSLQSPTMITSASVPNLAPVAIERLEESKPASETPPKPSRADARSSAAKRQQRMIKTFTKVMVGKSVLVLTDKTDLKKQITRVLLADGTSMQFIKTSNELWQRLRDAKEEYHVLLIDLTKAEMQIEPMLRAIRQQGRYSQLPIVVLSLERELPELVRSCCSFVVFLPLAAAMLREALVWCFDRKSVQRLVRYEEDGEDMVVGGKATSIVASPPVVLAT